MNPRRNAEAACGHWVRNSAGAGWRQVGEALRPVSMTPQDYYSRRERAPAMSPKAEAFFVGVVVGIVLSVWLVQ